MSGDSDIIKIKIPNFVSKDFTSHMRKNPWIVSTFVLGILVLILLIGSVFGTGVSGMVSASDAGNKVVNFLNQNSDAQLILNEVSSQSGLYKVSVDYQGNLIPLYVTTDGNYFIQELIPISSSAKGSSGPTNSGSSVPVSEDDDAVLGSPNAEVTIIEFSDYQCPFCRKFWSETLGQIKSTYIDTGKVKLVYRDFPLSIHPQAQIAAEAAECIREKGGDEIYFEYHDLIFENQQTLSESNLKQWASDLGHDISSCLDSGRYTSEVQADFLEGQAAGVTGTPSFFINGQPVSGTQPFSVFEKIIESELSN